MPILPLDHVEPFAATLGVMLYPGLDEGDRRRAAAFASHYLAEPIDRYRRSGGVITHGNLLSIVTQSGERLDDLDKRWWAGTATGELLKAFFALSQTDARYASWEHAAALAEQAAAKEKVPGSRSSLMKAKGQFLSVAHLWAAWVIRDGKFSQHPDAGYDYATDFQAFLMEAEILRDWGQTWRASRDKSAPPLPNDVWRVPDEWVPPEWQPEWPGAGRIPVMTIPAELLSGLKPAGRPKKRR